MPLGRTNDCGTPCVKSLARAGIDQPRAVGEIAVVEQVRGGDLAHVARVGDVAIDVGERELHRLDQQVLNVDRVDRMTREVEMARDAERHQRGDSLAVRRDLVQDIVGAVATAAGLLDRIDPVDAVVAEIAFGHRRAAGPRVRRDRGGRPAPR